MFIQDDYCPDKKLLQELSDKAKWQELAGRFHWWDGWWAGEPRNTWEYIIKMIWEAQGVEGKIAGFEYWCNILESDNQQTNHLGWHRDKDELLKEESGEIVCPMVGTIFYGYPHDIEGGFLEIATEDTFTDVERIRPIYNRVVIMDVSKQHRVTRIYRGTRIGLQINLWLKKPETFRNGDIETTSSY